MPAKISDNRARKPIGQTASPVAEHMMQSARISIARAYIPSDGGSRPRAPDEHAGSGAIRGHAGVVGLKVEASPNG